MELSMETPADLLALIPFVMEREPDNIVVLVCMKDGRLMCLMGIEHCKKDDMIGYVRAIMEQMTEVKPEALTMVFYEPEVEDPTCLPSEQTDLLVRLTADVLTPMDTMPGLVVKGGKYKVVGMDHWHDIDEVRQSQVAAGLVLNGVPLQQQGIIIPEPTGLTDAMRERIDIAEATIPEFEGRLVEQWRTPFVTELRALYGELLDRGYGATEPEAARIIAAMQLPELRDRLMVDTIAHVDELEAFGETICGLSEAMPDYGKLRSGLSLMNNLMQYTDDEHRPPLLVTCAWFEWMMGRAMDARTYCEKALEVNPDYTLGKAFLRYVTELMRIPVSILHRERIDGE